MIILTFFNMADQETHGPQAKQNWHPVKDSNPVQLQNFPHTEARRGQQLD